MGIGSLAQRMNRGLQAPSQRQRQGDQERCAFEQLACHSEISGDPEKTRSLGQKFSGHLHDRVSEDCRSLRANPGWPRKSTAALAITDAIATRSSQTPLDMWRPPHHSARKRLIKEPQQYPNLRGFHVRSLYTFDHRRRRRRVRYRALERRRGVLARGHDRPLKERSPARPRL